MSFAARGKYAIQQHCSQALHVIICLRGAMALGIHSIAAQLHSPNSWENNSVKTISYISHFQPPEEMCLMAERVHVFLCFLGSMEQQLRCLTDNQATWVRFPNLTL